MTVDQLWIALLVVAEISLLFAALLFLSAMLKRQATARQKIKDKEIADKLDELNQDVSELTQNVSELRQNISDKDNEIELLRHELDETDAAKARHEAVIAHIAEAHRAQNGRTALVVKIDGESDLYASESMADILNEAGTNALDMCDTYKYGEQVYKVTSSHDDDISVYVVADITSDEVEIPELILKNGSLEKKLGSLDMYTSALNREAWLARVDELSKDTGGTFMFLQLGGSTVTDFGSVRESYVKACADILIESCPNGVLGRFSPDGFCQWMPDVTPEVALGSAEELLKKLSALSGTYFLTDDDMIGAIVELVAYQGHDPSQLMASMETRIAVDRHHGFVGVRLVGEHEAELIAGRRDIIERFISNGKLRFSYRPIAQSVNARVFGYQMIPDLSDMDFDDLNDALYQAEIFGLVQQLEDFILSEGMRCYEREVAEGNLLYTTHVWIDSLSGSCMTRDDAQTFHEKHYDTLKNLVVELTEHVGDKERMRLKKHRIENWGAACAVSLGADREEGLLKILELDPDIVRVSVNVLEDKVTSALLREFVSRRDGRAVAIAADDISTAAQLKTAITAGATYLMGDYIGKAENTTNGVSDKCMNDIAKIQFGKRG